MTHNEECCFMGEQMIALNIAVGVATAPNEDGSCSCGNSGCTDVGKHPITARGVKDATKDVTILRKWLLEDPEQELNPYKRKRNIFAATGERSGITVLDIDIGEGKQGLATWSELIREHGEPDTLRATTGGGGAHLVFQYNSALKTSSNTLGKHVDCRNDNGYIIVAPSLHKSGRRYSWDNWGTPIAPLPAHLSKKKDMRGRPRKDDLYKGKYTLAQVTEMLEHVPADDRDLWRAIGIALGREYKCADAAWAEYVAWADKYTGKKGRGHDEIMKQCFYELSQEESENPITMGTIIKAALDNGWAPKRGEVPPKAFVYYGPGNCYIYRTTGSSWIATGVDVVCSPVNEGGKLTKASEWIKTNFHATSMTRDPAIDEDYVKGVDCREGQIIHSLGSAILNTYRRPIIDLGDAQLAGPFIEHCRRIFNKPGDADQFLNYMAHRVQKPWEKPRFALLLAGGQGIGKDTAIELCLPAIGEWNVANIEPSAFDSNYNDFVASTLVRINEASNLHEMSKWAFNERTKVLIAGTPDIVRVNPKYGEQFSVKMYCGVIITTNNLASGIFIPPDDRRYDVIDCASMEDMGLGEDGVRRQYFTDLWEWYHHGGSTHVAAFLHERVLNGFSPNNGQRKTAAHREVIRSNGTGDMWLDDILDGLGYPDLVRSDWILERAERAGEKKGDVLRKLSPSIGRLGYTRLINHERLDGRWKVQGLRFMLYARNGVVLEGDFLAKITIPPPEN